MRALAAITLGFSLTLFSAEPDRKQSATSSSATIAEKAKVIPVFDDDAAADRWLREHSAAYRKMGETVDRKGGYKFVRTERVQLSDGPMDVQTSAAFTKDGQRTIALHPRLKGPPALTVMIFELANHFHEDSHAEINAEARLGLIKTADEYGILRQLVEYDGLRIHYGILHELTNSVGELPPGFFEGIHPVARKLSEYQVPSVYQLLKSQRESGHRDYYKKIFGFLTKDTRKSELPQR